MCASLLCTLSALLTYPVGTSSDLHVASDAVQSSTTTTSNNTRAGGHDRTLRVLLGSVPSKPNPGQGYAETPAEALAKLRNETKANYWRQGSEVIRLVVGSILLRLPVASRCFMLLPDASGCS